MVLCKLVYAEKPPLRLPLGQDAIELVHKKIHNVGVELDRRHEQSLLTGIQD